MVRWLPMVSRCCITLERASQPLSEALTVNGGLVERRVEYWRRRERPGGGETTKDYIGFFALDAERVLGQAATRVLVEDAEQLAEVVLVDHELLVLHEVGRWEAHLAHVPMNVGDGDAPYVAAV